MIRLVQIAQGSSGVSFTYDNDGRCTTLTLPNGVTMSYAYDAASQLTGIGYGSLGTLTYAYDLAGRRTTVGGSFARSSVPAALTNASYNANNQLTRFGSQSMTYDANGNLTSDGVNTYTWDARDHLVSISGVVSANFQYDAFGRRVSKTVGGTTGYLYDGINPVQELSGGTLAANLLTGLGVDEYFQRTDASGAANFLTDASGSTVALTSSSSSTMASYTYEPFGNTTLASGSSANPYQYTGRENDGTGLYYYRGRYYNPALQRFISEDPLGYAANSVNLYEYTYDDPTNFRDPSGLQEIFIFFEQPPIAVDPDLLDQARDLAAPKQSLPMPDGGRIDLGPSDPNVEQPDHYVKGQGPVPTPHVHDPLAPFDPPYDQYPRGLDPDPRPATNDDLIRAIQHNSPSSLPPMAPGAAKALAGRKSPQNRSNPPSRPDPCGGFHSPLFYYRPCVIG